MSRLMQFILFVCCGTMCLILPGFLSGPPGNPEFLDRCPIPRITAISSVTDTTAMVTWTRSDSALQTDLQWREAGAPDWVTIPDVNSPFILKSLSPCIAYDARVQSHCNGSDSEFSPVVAFDADGCCRIPTGIHLTSSTATTATIEWDRVSFAFAHHVRYKAVDADEWIETTTDTNRIVLSDLIGCTAYELQVGSKCDLDSTEYSASLEFQTVDCGACTSQFYCSAAADDASMEWIDSVAFGTVRLQSGNNDGYLLKNTTQTGIERKRPYVFHVTPGAMLQTTQFYLRMWIDLDQDGMFADSSELLVDPVGPIDVNGWTQTITISDTVALGQTRMRIALKAITGQDTLRPSGCGNFLFGEVEDYCISIDDVCPEVVPVLLNVTETTAVIKWDDIDASIIFIYRYREVGAMQFSDPELTQDTIIEIMDLKKCKEYQLQTLSVCVQDTSSWQDFFFKTQCPNAVVDVLPVASEAQIYPNPFSDQFILAMRPDISGMAEVRLFNMMGAQLEGRIIDLQQGIAQQIEFTSLDNLAHGMYLVILQSGDRQQVFKMVK